VQSKSTCLQDIVQDLLQGDERLITPKFRHEGKQFILKEIIPGDFDHITQLQKHVEHSPYVRTAVDSIPERHIFVFPYLEQDLYHIKTTALDPTARESIIKDALTGLADLHDQHIIHRGQIIPL
jgi:serine/threonine protein kinase